MAVVEQLCEEIQGFLGQSRVRALPPKEIALLASALVLLRHLQEQLDAALRADQRDRRRALESPGADRGGGEVRDQSVLSKPLRDPRVGVGKLSNPPF